MLSIALLAGGSYEPVCTSCHAMRPFAVSRQSGAHKSVPCYACHLASGWWSLPDAKSAEVLRMYPAALLGRASKGLRSSARETDRGACLVCHDDMVKLLISKRRLRIKHETCAPAPGSCDACHANVAHGSGIRFSRRFEMDECVRCHKQSAASLQCDTCHSTPRTGGGPPLGSYAATHGRRQSADHGRGDLTTCETCHKKDYCVRCHGVPLPHPKGFYLDHGTAAKRVAGKCADCHSRKDFCDACHGLPMPHPKGFLKAHPNTTKSVRDATCLKCHFADTCAKCHAAHPRPSPHALGSGPKAGPAR